MSSREIAELCEKEHHHVLRDIRAYVGAIVQAERGLDVRGQDWSGTEGVELFGYTPIGGVTVRFEVNEQNGQSYPIYDLDKVATITIIAGYNILLRKRIIERWQELERAAVTPAPVHHIPGTMHEALRLADLAEGKLLAETALAAAAPKAAALDRLATETAGAVCLRVAAKLLQMPEKRFLQFARVKGFIFRGPRGTWQGYAEKAKAGLLELKLTTVQCTDRTERHVEQVLVTRSGLAKLAELLAKDVTGLAEVRRA